MKCHLLYLLKPYIVRTYHSQHHPLDRESFCTSRILPWNIVYCVLKMSLFVHSCWTESGNKSSHENISVLIFHLMFIVIIIRVNSFRLAVDTLHYGKSKLLIWGCGSECSHVIELQWTPERGGKWGKMSPVPVLGGTSPVQALEPLALPVSVPSLGCILLLPPSAVSRAVRTSLTLPSPPPSWTCLQPQGRGQRKLEECSCLLRQGRSLWKCFDSPENALSTEPLVETGVPARAQRWGCLQWVIRTFS